MDEILGILTIICFGLIAVHGALYIMTGDPIRGFLEAGAGCLACAYALPAAIREIRRII